MSRAPELSIVIPSFDEVERIGATVAHVMAYLAGSGRDWELFVVIDGGPASMQTAAVGAAAGSDRVHVLVNDRNRGKGYTVRRGVLATTGRVVGFLDADLAQPIEALPGFLDRIAAGAHVAIGLRSTAARRPRPLRRLASALFGRTARAVLGLPFTDTQCGMKVFEGETGRALFRAQCLDRFAFDAELLLIARRWGLRVDEVPLVVAPPGTSTVRLLRDGAHMLLELLRVRWRAWRGAYDRPGTPYFRGSTSA